MTNVNRDGGDDYFIYRGEGDGEVSKDVIHVNFHPSVRAIKHRTFVGCSRLSVVSLNEGLQEIGVAAFFRCTSLREIIIPHSVKAIQHVAFHRCTELTFVNLSEGLEEIGEQAFCECTSLQEIRIPPAI